MQALTVGPYASLRVAPSTGDACCSSCARGGACEGACPGTAPPSPMDALRGSKGTGYAAPARRRTTGDEDVGGDDTSPDDDGTEVQVLGQKWANLSPQARRDALERIGRAAGLSNDATQRMVSSLVNAGLNTVNTYLRNNAQIEIRRIEANRDIAIARIRAQGGSVVNPIDGGSNGETLVTANQRDTASGSGSSDNTWLYVGLGLAAVWAMKGRRR